MADCAGAFAGGTLADADIPVGSFLTPESEDDTEISDEDFETSTSVFLLLQAFSLGGGASTYFTGGGDA